MDEKLLNMKGMLPHVHKDFYLTEERGVAQQVFPKTGELKKKLRWKLNCCMQWIILCYGCFLRAPCPFTCLCGKPKPEVGRAHFPSSVMGIHYKPRQEKTGKLF